MCFCVIRPTTITTTKTTTEVFPKNDLTGHEATLARQLLRSSDSKINAQQQQ